MFRHMPSVAYGRSARTTNRFAPTPAQTRFVLPVEVRQLAWSMSKEPYRVMIGNRDQPKANQDVVQQVRIVEGRQKRQAIVDLLTEVVARCRVMPPRFNGPTRGGVSARGPGLSSAHNVETCEARHGFPF